MAPVDQHDQLDRLRPAEVDQRIERRPNRPARIEHVVDEQDLLVVDRERDLRAPHDGLRSDGVPHQVVAVERDVERAGRHLVAVDAGDGTRETPGHRDAPGPDADQAELLDAPIALENLVRDAHERSAHAVGVHYDGHGGIHARDREDSGDRRN